MKKLFALLTVVGILAGCSGFQISDNSNHQALGYVAGKGTAIGVYKLYPKAAPALEQSWMDMMGRCYNLTEIPPAEMLGFFNESIIKVMPNFTDDKYGLAGDLRALMIIYGAEFASDGTMLSLKPVPMSVARMFQAGYEGGRSVAIMR